MEEAVSLVNGKAQSVDSPASVLIYPGDGRESGRTYSANMSTIDTAVDSAREAFQSGIWSDRSPDERAKILALAAERIRSSKDQIAELDRLDMGKPIARSKEDAIAAAEIIESAGRAATFLSGTQFPAGPRCLAYNEQIPVGVVAAITPWNYPAPNAAHKLGAALAVGNSVVLKPSENSPRSALIIAQCAIEAGVPENVIQVLIGGKEVGAALAEHNAIDLVSFTGSTRAGKEILISAGGSNAKRTVLECGGKSPQIVLPDFPVSKALVTKLASAAFANSGQLCVAKSRLLVHSSIADELAALFVEEAKQHHPSDPEDEKSLYGPLAHCGHFEAVQDHIRTADELGLNCIYRGEVHEAGEGLYTAPVIYDHALGDAPLVQNEVFGPVVVIQRYESEAEAIALANATQFGLSASLWTQDLATARRISRSLRAGYVEVFSTDNETEFAPTSLSCEPLRQSGYGVEGGLDGVRSYTAQKATVYFN